MEKRDHDFHESIHGSMVYSWTKKVHLKELQTTICINDCCLNFGIPQADFPEFTFSRVANDVRQEPLKNCPRLIWTRLQQL